MLRRPADNPFRVSRVHELRYLAHAQPWPELLDRLASMGYRAAVVGDHGAGKSTLLRALCERLPQRSVRVRWIALDAGRRAFAPGEDAAFGARVCADEVVVFDGANHLSAWQWWRFRRHVAHARGLLISEHASSRLPTLAHLRPDACLLRQLIDQLAPGDAHALARGERLLRDHRGNVRDTLRQLYDEYAVR